MRAHHPNPDKRAQRNHDDTDREQTPDRGLFIEIGRQHEGHKWPHQKVEKRKAPRTIPKWKGKDGNEIGWEIEIDRQI